MAQKLHHFCQTNQHKKKNIYKSKPFFFHFYTVEFSYKQQKKCKNQQNATKKKNKQSYSSIQLRDTQEKKSKKKYKNTHLAYNYN